MSSLGGAIRSAWLDLLWRSWRSLGVRASHAPLVDVIVDPESLIIASAGLTASGADPRVRSHALYWCIQNQRLVATARLKRLALRMPSELTEPFRHFAATVNAEAGTTWPDEGVAADVYDVREFPAVPMASLDPALLKVRLRLLMGANARSEVMATCLSRSATHFELRALEQVTTFARRHLAEPVADLARGGWLNHDLVGNRHRYVCSDRSLTAFGAAAWVDWPRRFEAFASLVRAADHHDTGNVVGVVAELRGHADLWRDEARILVPSPIRVDELPADRAAELQRWIRGAADVLTAVT